MKKQKQETPTLDVESFISVDFKKRKPKITDQAPCPICGGCVWFVDDKYKCGWCGYDGNDTNKMPEVKG